MKGKMMKVLPMIAIALSLTACGGGEDKPTDKQSEESPPAVTDLSGEWKTETDEDGGCMGAYIEGEYIEVYWVMPSEDTVALYWSGSFTAPSGEDDGPYSWTSQADSERNASAIMASPDETKEFTYENQEISCSVSLMGATKKMAFTKGEWGYSELPKEETGGTGGAKMEGSGDLGDYHVEIKGASIVKDYEDNPAIVVTYAWTNNSEDTTSASTAMYAKAFQDGVQLDSAWVDSDEYDGGADMKEVRPGTTIDVQDAFELTSETSTVEFEISEFFGSDDIVTTNFEPANLS